MTTLPPDLSPQRKHETDEMSEPQWLGDRIATLGDPAVGSDLSWKGPTRSAFTVVTFHAAFTSSATVANRAFSLRMTDADGNIIADLGSGVTVAASSSSITTWGIGLSSNIADVNAAVQSLPQIWLPPGAVLKTDTGNIQAGDQWSDIVIAYRGSM